MENEKSPELLKLNFSFKEPWRQKLFSTMEGPLKKLLALNQINNVYCRIAEDIEPIEFPDKVLRALGARYDVSARDLEHLPKQGPILVIANHPFGGIEGIIMASILKSVRTDVKLMANYMLAHIPEMRDIIICVDPFGTSNSTRFNIKPLKESIGWLNQGHVLGIFPAGEVSHIHVQQREITDPSWNHTLAGLALRTKAAVIPMFFDGYNGPLFQTFGLVHPRLRTLMLPRQVLKTCDKTIEVRIGSPIFHKKLTRFESEQELTSYLRFRTYMLKNRRVQTERLRKRSFFTALRKPVQETLIRPVDPKTVMKEVSNLPPESLLLEGGDFIVFQARAREIPNALREIGRLRELTFRREGEGTGKPLDLDGYDDYYTHMFLWNTENREIAGAYRVGEVNAILNRYGLKGLYSSTLFKYNPLFFATISPALEMGRSFIRPEYQKNYSSLLLLWKGLGQMVLKNPKIRYLFGPVSINDAYQPISRELIIACLSGRRYSSSLAGMVSPKKPPTRMRVKELGSRLAQTVIRELEEVSALIADVESDQKSLPILLKQYLKLGGKLLGFNVDPAFSYVMDGLILVDLTKTEENILERYMGKEGAAEYLALHGRG